MGVELVPGVDLRMDQMGRDFVVIKFNENLRQGVLGPSVRATRRAPAVQAGQKEMLAILQLQARCRVRRRRQHQPCRFKNPGGDKDAVGLQGFAIVQRDRDLIGVFIEAADKAGAVLKGRVVAQSVERLAGCIDQPPGAAMQALTAQMTGTTNGLPGRAEMHSCGDQLFAAARKPIQQGLTLWTSLYRCQFFGVERRKQGL